MLQPETLFERFAYRRANQISGNKDFLAVKGQRFQVENQPTRPVKRENKVIGFKCMHYSVTESAGTVKIAIKRKTLHQELSFGVRTREDTAKVGRDYDHIDNVITLKENEEERIIEVKIHDDDEWNPDNDFYVELYDTRTKKRLMGDDAECKVTILDEDFPGKLVFKDTEVMGSRRNNKVEVVVNRVEGTDGSISCQIRTEPFITGKGNENNFQNAIADTDYGALS